MKFLLRTMLILAMASPSFANQFSVYVSIHGDRTIIFDNDPNNVSLSVDAFNNPDDLFPSMKHNYFVTATTSLQTDYFSGVTITSLDSAVQRISVEKISLLGHDLAGDPKNITVKTSLACRRLNVSANNSELMVELEQLNDSAKILNCWID